MAAGKIISPAAYDRFKSVKKFAVLLSIGLLQLAVMMPHYIPIAHTISPCSVGHRLLKCLLGRNDILVKRPLQIGKGLLSTRSVKDCTALPFLGIAQVLCL